MVCHEISAWNHTIKELSQKRLTQDALQAFHDLQLQGFIPLKATYVCLVSSFTCDTFLDHAKRLYCLLIHRSFHLNVVVGTALLNMFDKCGSTDHARRLFDEMQWRNVVTWTSMISTCGSFVDAFQLFDKMLVEGVFPNKLAC